MVRSALGQVRAKLLERRLQGGNYYPRQTKLLSRVDDWKMSLIFPFHVHVHCSWFNSKVMYSMMCTSLLALNLPTCYTEVIQKEIHLPVVRTPKL